MNWRRILLSLLTFATVGPAQQTPDSLFQSAHDDLDQGRYAPAIEKARRSIEAFSKSGNQRRVAQAQTVAGLAELYLGDYASGLRDLEIALQFARDTHDLGNEVGRLNDIGSAFYFQGLYGEAMDRYQQAARAVEANQKDEWSNWGRQITQSNIAILRSEERRVGKEC